MLPIGSSEDSVKVIAYIDYDENGMAKIVDYRRVPVYSERQRLGKERWQHMSEQLFINPYNFIPFGKSVDKKRKSRESAYRLKGNASQRLAYGFIGNKNPDRSSSGRGASPLLGLREKSSMRKIRNRIKRKIFIKNIISFEFRRRRKSSRLFREANLEE